MPFESLTEFVIMITLAACLMRDGPNKGVRKYVKQSGVVEVEDDDEHLCSCSDLAN